MKVLNLREKPKIKILSKAVPKKILEKDKAIPTIKATPKIPTSLPKKESLQITWQAQSFYSNPSKKYIYTMIFSLIIAGCILLFFKIDVLMAIFFILSSIVLSLYSQKKPEVIKILLDQRGVIIGEKEYYYKDLKSFWINYQPGNIKELSLESKKWYMPYITISIEDKNPLSIRSILINHIPEKEHEESLIDLASKKIGL